MLAALAERLPEEAVLVEEAPSSRPELHARIPARRPLGFLSAAMGGLGFGLSAPIGLRMALPERPVVAVVGDGSSLYSIQALWSAARYEVGVLFVILNNGGYRVMDRLAEMQGESAPWPAFETVDVSGMARALGCDARRVDEHGELLRRARRGAAGAGGAHDAAAARGDRGAGPGLRSVAHRGGAPPARLGVSGRLI